MPQTAVLSILKQAQAYVFQLHLPGPRHGAAVLYASLPLTQAAEQSLRDQIEKTTQLLNDLVIHRRPPERRDDAPLSDPLVGLGRLIYNQLLPPPIQQALQELPAGSPLLIVTNDSELPWELAHDDEDYLALKHRVARQMLAHRPPRQNVVRRGRRWTSLLIGNPTGDLPETETEIEGLIHLIEALPGTAPPRFLMGRRATREAVLQELASGAYDLIHYSGHATFNPQEPSASGLILAWDEVLTATEIEKNLGGRPMVFLNGCESARGRAGEEEMEGLVYLGPAAQGLASAFIQGGARGFVGTFWPVTDTNSGDFALAFYRTALQGEAIGEALRMARDRARRAGPTAPLWASFVLYGDPDLPLLTAKQTERRPATVLVARLPGLDTLFGDAHGEEAASIVERHLAAQAAQVTRYGGQVYGLAHDTLIGAFGISTTHQNDAERAVRAALSMRETVDRLRQEDDGLSLALGVGLSSGDVFVSFGRALRPLDRLRTPLGTTQAQDSARDRADAGESDQMMPVVTGEVVNQAAWLARQADDREILIAESVQRLTGRLFEADPRSLAGPRSPETLTAYRVLGLKPELPLPGRQTAMIGRERELARLQEAWRMSRRGRGQIVGVVGEAGVGKSRLLHEFRKALEDHDILWLTATCPSAYSPGPYELVARLLRPLLGLTTGLRSGDLAQHGGGGQETWPNGTPAGATVKGKLRATLRRLPGDGLSEQERLESLAILGDILGTPFPEVSLAHLDPKGRRRRLVNILGQLLAQRASEAPLVLALEDLHRIDDTSLDTLSQLVVRLDRLPILVIGLFRSEADWQPPWWNRRNYHLVHLDTLDEAEGRALLAALLETEEVPEEIASVVLPQAGGNPFFVRELVTSLQESGVLEHRNGTWRLIRRPGETEVPGTVQRVILARMEGLPEAAQQVLPVATVAGDTFEYQMLQAVMAETGDGATLDEGLSQLEEREFIYCRWGEEAYHFTHALIQEVAYESLLAEERRRYHRRLGRALEQVYAGREAEVLERLAHHFYHSNDRVNAICYGLRAAARAAEAWANQAALNWYDRALGKIQSFDETPPAEAEQEQGTTPAQILLWHVEALEGKAGVQSVIGHIDEAIAGYRWALELAADPDVFPAPRRADLHRRMAIAYHDKGELDAAQECLNEGLKALNGVTCLEAGRLHVWIGLLHFRSGRLNQALTACERGIAIIEQTDSIQDLARAYNLQGLIYRVMGESQKAIHAHERSSALYQEAEDIAGLERAYSNLGCVYQDLSRWEEALRYFQKSAELSDRTGEEWRRAAAAINLGEIYRRQGELDRAIELYEQAGLIGEDFGFAEALGMALMNLGASYLKQGKMAEARDYLEESQDVFRHIGTDVYLPEALRYLAELEVMDGQPEEALPLAREALDWASKLGRRLEAGQAHRVLGQVYRALGRLQEAETHLRESLAILEAQNSPYEVGLTLAELAVLRTAEADAGEDGDALREQAKAYCDRAIEIFEELGARLDLQMAQEIRGAL